MFQWEGFVVTVVVTAVAVVTDAVAIATVPVTDTVTKKILSLSRCVSVVSGAAIATGVSRIRALSGGQHGVEHKG